jgi:hypothetical protein
MLRARPFKEQDFIHRNHPATPTPRAADRVVRVGKSMYETTEKVVGQGSWVSLGLCCWTGRHIDQQRQMSVYTSYTLAQVSAYNAVA